MIYVLLFLFGVALSAFFSGSETGLYRVPKVRLILDGLSGSWVARGLLWLANHKTLFVGTVLVGNNIANYITSFAVVMAVPLLIGNQQTATELVGSIVATPIVFVFGELLPKYLFFHAPTRLLRFSGVPLMVTTLLFLPVTIVLGALGSLLSSFTGKQPFQSRLRMARGELQKVLRDGHEVGLLGPSQQRTAQNIWLVGEKPAINFAVPPNRLARISSDATREEAITTARRMGHPLILVEDLRSKQTVGYLRYADLVSAKDPLKDRILTTIRVPEKAKNLSVLLSLYDGNSDVAELVAPSGKVVAIVTRRQLQEPLMTH